MQSSRKKLLFLLPFYIMRYEKSREEIEKDPAKLRNLLEEYAAIVRKLKEDILEKGKEAQYRYLIEVIKRIADYIFANSEITRKGVDDVMGGNILELKTDKLINEIKEEVGKEIVIRMLKKGNYSLEEIADDTQMSLEQVKKIQKEQQL